MSTLVPRRAALLLFAAVLAGACTDTAPTAVDSSAQLSTTGASLVECPTPLSRSVSGVIGPLGGTLSLDGTSISLPLGAVSVPVPLTLTLPASRYMEVDISVAGVSHFEFLVPVDVTIGYARCTRSDIDQKPLTAWYIDSRTKALLQNMGGTDDKTARTVTFRTDHLSGYSIAQ